MSEFLFSYGLFFAKIITGLIALIFVIAIISSTRKKESDTNLTVTNINDSYQNLNKKLMSAILDKKEFKQQTKDLAKADKKAAKKIVTPKKPRLYVLEFDGDIKASEVSTLRDEITALLSFAAPEDEILLKLDNAGGVVHEHGLAASQLRRIKDAKLKLTVSVDKVAASGGYMMACVADKIIAAPFAIIGSIGVLAQLPNFNRLLDKHGIDFEQHTAGEFKRTVTMFGKNGDKERKKLKLDLQETHTLFRNFVASNRPKLDIDKVATGEHWYGIQALELKLVDEIKTSDDFLMEAINHYHVYRIKIEKKQALQEKLFGGLFASAEKAKDAITEQQNKSQYL